MTKPRKLTPEEDADVEALDRAAVTLLLLTRNLTGDAAEQAKATAEHLQGMSRRIKTPPPKRRLQ